MSIQLLKANTRGEFQLDWLHSRHAFSFGHYYDPARMGWGVLRVINDDIVSPGGGFDTHGHHDMEIISYVIEGTLVHGDSLGHRQKVQAGEVQLMRAGSGIAHSEFNGSDEVPVHFLQIWIKPEKVGLKPGYQQLTLPWIEQDWVCVVAPEHAAPNWPQSLLIAQDAWLWAARFSDKPMIRALKPERRYWVQVVSGTLKLNGQAMTMGDGAGILEESQLVFEGQGEVLLFDLPA